jgi:type IV secretory pathway VirB10-like protein
MPLSTRSIIEPGDIRSRAPLKKSTIAWGLAGVVLLAVMGVLAPRLLRDSDAPASPPQDRVVNAGQARQIDNEFDEAQRRLRSQGVQSTPITPVAPPVPPAAVLTAPLPPGSPAVIVPVIPPDVRRDQNSPVLYGRHPDSSDASGALEMEAAARSSPGVRHDFGEAPASASSQVVDTGLAPLRNLVAESGAPAPTTSISASDRLAGLLEGQQRRPDASAGGRAWLQEWSDPPRRASLRPTPAPGAFTLLQGKVLPAVLGRDLNTDLPGEVTAITTEDVYDSLASRHLLIPKGSVLSGKYSNAIRTGQERILFAFTRITLPDGSGIDLPGFGGADQAGAAGVEGKVDNHFFRQFASSLLVAFLANRVERDRTGPSIVAGSTQGGAVSAAGQVLVDVSRSILDRNKSIEPTITVAKGSRLLVEVTRDIEFPTAWRSR